MPQSEAECFWHGAHCLNEGALLYARVHACHCAELYYNSTGLLKRAAFPPTRSSVLAQGGLNAAQLPEGLTQLLKAKMGLQTAT